MNRIRFAFGLVVALLLALWLATLPFAGLLPQVFALRGPFLQGTGVLAIGLMSVAMVLATRPVFFEPALGGLDKMYRLHKWLGVAALALVVAHWLWVEVPKWLVGLGVLARPVRLPTEVPAQPLLRELQALRGTAEGVGEAAFYALVLLLVLALLPRLPYRWFFRTHRLLPLVYLALVFHSVVLLEPGAWLQPLGAVMALLMLAGTVAAVGVLLGAVGRRRQALAVVERTTFHRELSVLEVAAQLQGRWPGHAAGQFAFVRFGTRENAHPYTITSPWVGDGRLVFLIKGLGRHTRQLPRLLKPGSLLRVEGPYGQFNFAGPRQRQVWVGGGIGITPFLARLQQLALQPDGKTVDLFHTTAEVDEAAFAYLRASARAAGVKLHLMVDALDGRLNAERLCAAVPAWREADVWFCGPAAFGQALKRELRARGLPATEFHQELFSLR